MLADLSMSEIDRIVVPGSSAKLLPSRQKEA
jgi:hypothetical protein